MTHKLSCSKLASIRFTEPRIQSIFSTVLLGSSPSNPGICGRIVRLFVCLFVQSSKQTSPRLLLTQPFLYPVENGGFQLSTQSQKQKFWKEKETNSRKFSSRIRSTLRHESTIISPEKMKLGILFVFSRRAPVRKQLRSALANSSRLQNPAKFCTTEQ